MTVTMLAVLRGFRKPDGILCHYPVFGIDENRFFPSLLLAVDEELLSSCFMKFALACFTRKGGSAVNPIMSPMHAPPDLIKELPPCKFMAAQIDGLRDQSFYMALKILKNGGQADIQVMQDFIHGFCNMDTNHFGINEYRRGTEITTSLFRQLFLEADEKRHKNPPEIPQYKPDEMFDVIDGYEPELPDNPYTKQKMEESKSQPKEERKEAPSGDLK